MSHFIVLLEFLTDSLQMEERLRETENITFNYLHTHTPTHSFRERVTQSNLFNLIEASLTSFKDQSQCFCYESWI